MCQSWVVHLERSEIESLKRLRLAEGAEVCEQGDEIWVRGTSISESLARQLRRHPHARRHWILPDKQLVSPGQLVPKGYLPDGPWTSLKDWLSVEVPNAAFPGRIASRIPIRLVRVAVERPANVLLTDMDRWCDHGRIAPKARLDRWFFAVAADGRVAVRGLPLPSIWGVRFVEQAGVAVPCGWTWSPPVGAETLRSVMHLQDQDLAILNTDNTCERIPGGDFVLARRSAIVQTAREFRHE